MASISKNGGEVARLTRTDRSDIFGELQVTLVFCANGWVLRKRHIPGTTRGSFKRVARVKSATNKGANDQAQVDRIRGIAAATAAKPGFGWEIQL